MAAPVVLITGASSGIGRATAQLFSRNDYRVFGTSRSVENAPKFAGVEFIPIDVRNDACVEAAAASVLAKSGRIDVLVNNAGYTILGAAEETSVAEAQALFDTNVFGVLRVSRAVVPAMRAAGKGRMRRPLKSDPAPP